MTTTEHDKLRAIAEQLVGDTLPNKTSGFYLERIRQNIGERSTESTGTDFTLTDPNVDTLACDTSDGPVTVTLAETFQSAGSEIVISDVTSNAATNSITVTPENTTIDGNGNVVIDSDGGSVQLQWVESLTASNRFTVLGTVGVSL